MQTLHIDYEQINLADLPSDEQMERNMDRILQLRKQFAKTHSGQELDEDWLKIRSKKPTRHAAICFIARQPRGELMTKNLSDLPYSQREAIRLAVAALEFQKEFRCGCDPKLWHPAQKTKSIGDIEREKKERAAKLEQKRAIATAIEMRRQGARPTGQ